MTQTLAPPEALLLLDDVALILRVSRRSVQRLVAAGELQPIRVGGLTRFVADDVRDYIAKKREVPPDE